VTPWNVERLRQLVINGPDEHPGAVAVEDEAGRLVVLAKLPREKREALSKQLLSDFTGAVPARCWRCCCQHRQHCKRRPCTHP
jgi:DNA-directed RNA polymerase I subunit RPA1